MCGSSKKWRENHIPSSALSSLSQWKVHFLGHTTCSNTSMLEGPLATDPYQNGLTQVPGSGLEVCHSQKISSWPVGWWWPRFTMIRHEGSSYNMLSWLDLFFTGSIDFCWKLNWHFNIGLPTRYCQKMRGSLGFNKKHLWNWIKTRNAKLRWILMELNHGSIWRYTHQLFLLQGI